MTLLALIAAVLIAQAAIPVPQTTEMVDLINADRETAGLPDLTVDDALTQLASTRAFQMAQSGHITHCRDYTDDTENNCPRSGLVVFDFHPPNTWSGENVAWDTANTVADANKRFLFSQRHKNNVLTPQDTKVGVAVCDRCLYGGSIYVEEFSQ